MNNSTKQKAKLWICLLSMIFGVSILNAASDDARLKIFSSQTKADIERKMERNEWAAKILTNAHKQVDKYVEIHKTDTLWMISRLQMYWKNQYKTPYINGGYYSRAEGHAPVPTVRFTGGRDWASDHNTPSIEDIVPYMDYRDDEIYLQNNKKEGRPWEWIKSSESAHKIEGINVSIMNKAMLAAFIYWLDGDESYAKFAYDIMVTYMDGIYYRDAPKAEIDTRNEHVIGLTSFEVIHEGILNHLPLCYDFLFEYIEKQNGDIPKMHAVLKKFADQVIVNGIANNNWNVFQACYIAYIALALDDDTTYEDSKGKQHYIDLILYQNSERQRALRDVCTAYDQQTGLWHESPGYSIATTKDLIEILLLVDGMDDSNILKDFSIVEKATLSSFEYLYPNHFTTAFGDNQYMRIDHAMSESLLALYRKHNMSDEENLLSAAVNEEIAEGIYNRDKDVSLYKLFNYVDEIKPDAVSEAGIYSTLLYAPNVNLTIQRNGMDRVNGLMLVNAGTGFNHCNANGINLELYGKGYVLGVDKARGSSYWLDDHKEYYNATISHNTVMIDGVSNNTSVRMGDNEISKEHKLLSNFPEKNQKDWKEPYALSYVDNSYWEASTNSDQRRVSGIVRTSPTSGYYVDIFRSRKVEGGDKKHEYIYHNAGHTLTLFDGNEAIAMKESSELTSAGGQAIGYDYLSDRYEADFDGDFKATFELNLGEVKGTIKMDVWMEGEQDRKLFSVKTPRALKGLGGDMNPEAESMPIPALIVRQSGEAWDRPFVAIYEPYVDSEGSTIAEVDYIECADSDFVGIEVESKCGAKEYIFNTTNPATKHTLKEINAEVAATYAVVSQRGDKVAYLFLGEGQSLSFGNYAITAEQCATAMVELCDCGGIKVKSDAPTTLAMPKKGSPTTLSYTDCKGTTQTLTAKKQGKQIVYTLPALDDVVLK